MAEITLLPLIQEAVKTAMRNRDKEIVTTLRMAISELKKEEIDDKVTLDDTCLLYTSPSPRDLSTSRMPSSA